MYVYIYTLCMYALIRICMYMHAQLTLSMCNLMHRCKALSHARTKAADSASTFASATHTCAICNDFMCYVCAKSAPTCASANVRWIFSADIVRMWRSEHNLQQCVISDVRMCHV